VVGTVSADPSGYDGIRGARLAESSAAGVRLERLELTDAQAVSSFIVRERPQFWLQHAGYVKDYDTPHYNLVKGNNVNVAALEGIYRALAAVGAKGIIVTGSMSEYGELGTACTESDACWPNTAYGLMKLAETIRARQLAIQYGIMTRVARIFIPFGALDSPAKLLPGTLAALQEGRPIDLTPCEQQRDFCAIEDIVVGYERLVADLHRRDVLFDLFNLCSGVATELKELLVLLADKLGADSSLLRFSRLPMRPGETPICFGSNEKAKRLLGWSPGSLDDRLEAYVREMTSL